MTPHTSLPVITGRGSARNPPNRFERVHVELDRAGGCAEAPETVLLQDRTRSIIAYNDAPDVGFDAGINPYRGCSHGCAYCYARPSHEYLGLSAGLDFETKILVKEEAPVLLRKALSARAWRPQIIGLSGNTDAYQHAEKKLGITRACLEVLADFRNPVQIVTKSHLVLRDTDLLTSLAAHDAAAVVLSITTLDPRIHRAMEPRAAAPRRRLEAIRALAREGVPVGVNVAPVVPGLTDHELPAILEAAAEAGALFAGYILLRLPYGVKDLFTEWLEAHVPERKSKVLNRVRELRGGKLYDARYEVRGRGQGPWAEQLRSLFTVTARRFGLNRPPRLSTSAFRVPPPPPGPQMDLFGQTRA